MQNTRIWSCACGEMGFSQELIETPDRKWVCPYCGSTEWDYEDREDNNGKTGTDIPFANKCIADLNDFFIPI